MKNKLLILFVLLLLTTAGYTQQMDTSLVLKNLKMRLFSELRFNILSESALNDYINRKLNVAILKSKGFDNIVFFQVSFQVLASDTVTDQNNTIYYFTPQDFTNVEQEGEPCYFVYAFDFKRNEFYRLWGTRTNDFLLFYLNMKDWKYWKPPSKIDKTTVRKFIETYTIEVESNVPDFECLMLALTGKKGYCLYYCLPASIVREH
ncbi:MAG: hypothetical protein ABI723_01225 [Bacteroidia bacterium]